MLLGNKGKVRSRYHMQSNQIGDRMGSNARFSKAYIMDWLLQTEQYFLRRYVYFLRKEEFYTFQRPNKFWQYYYKRKKNILGVKLGFFISAGCFQPGLKIEHYGSVIIHPKARIGENCTIHGNCCIGTKGGAATAAPVLGNHVDIGQNAQILGGIQIADGVRIGANAVVTQSVMETGVTVLGIPARILRKAAAPEADAFNNFTKSTLNS